MRIVAWTACGLLYSLAAPAQRLWELEPTRAVGLDMPSAVEQVALNWSPAVLGPEAEQLQLPLPGGRVLTVTRDRSELQPLGLGWFGRVAEVADSTVVLTAQGDQLAGYVALAGETWEISPSVDGPVLLRHDPHAFPECGGAEPVPALTEARLDATLVATGAASTDPASAAQAPADEPNEIDVLIVFSPGSLSALGGQPQAQTYAQNAVNLSNQVFGNSQMIARFRLAGVRYTGRADSGNSGTDLSWLRGDAEVAQWRNDTYADMVGMIAEFSNSCGQGYLMTTNSVGFAPNGFQVSARTCAIGNLTYPHEHGHNMGFAHNPEDSGSAVTTYAYAHWHNGSYRTVMSYSNPCTNGCTRQPYFSNPNVNFNGLPTGIANQRDNARAGDLTAPNVANFRDAPNPPPALVFRNGFE